MIIDLQRRIHEAGRIRIGQQVETASGKTRPAKLSTFRLTSLDARRIEDAAQLFGGDVQPWDSPAGPAWEVVTTTDRLQVLVPPHDMAFSQHYELWSAAGCARRCDGVNEVISQGPCLCVADARDCTVHSRLSVLIADMPGLGLWRLDTQGWYAARELAGAVDIIRMAAARGELLPATLRLEQRMTKRADPATRNYVTRRFAVPVLDIGISPNQLLSLGSAGGEPRPGMTLTHNLAGAEAPPALTTVTEPEPPTVAEPAKPAPKKRANAQTPIKKTGVKPRTRKQAEQPHESAARRAIIDEPAEPVNIVHEVADEPPPASPDISAALHYAELADEERKQNNLLHKLFREIGVTDHDERRIIASHILQGDIKTTKDLLPGQKSTLIDTMGRWLDDPETVETKVLDVLNTAALVQAGQTDLLDELQESVPPREQALGGTRDQG